MAVKSNFASGDVLTASDVNTYLTNGGLVYITQTLVSSGSAASISFNNVFSSTYDNYRLVIDNFQPSIGSRALQIRMRVGGVDATGTDYNDALSGIYTDGTSANTSGTGLTYMQTGLYNSATTLGVCSAIIDLIRPFKAERTYGNVVSSLYNAQFGGRTGMIEHNALTSYDGFTLLLNGTGNITTLNVRVYGYRNA